MQGAGSLLSYLRGKGYATGVSAGVGAGGHDSNTCGGKILTSTHIHMWYSMH